MKQVKIKNDIFNRIIKTVQGTLVMDNSRPVLKMCKCEVDEQYIRFITLDGFAATVFKIEHGCEDVEKFDFLFVPFTVYNDKSGQLTVTIEQVKGYTSFKWFDENLNELEKKVKPCGDRYIDVDKIYEGNRAAESFTIAFDPKLLIRVLKGFSGVDSCVKLTFDKADNNKPVFISGYSNELGEVESLVMPIRRVN